jgi:ribosomal protein S12 methylthiotransferase
LKISEGCKKRCAFCAIPLIRGNLQSRQISGILSEAKLLVAGGVKELIVVSHDFTDYGWDLRKRSPAAVESPDELLEVLADQSGAEWIRVLYLYPDGISARTLDLMESKPNLLRYFDMPLQHVSDSVLRRMNRRMTRAVIEATLADIRRRLPDATIRTQFIVGFPGETDSDFEELLDFVATQKFDRVGCFMYSQEEDTKAATLPDQGDEATKQDRHDRLMELQREISREKHRAFIGKTLSVVVEGFSEETDLLLVGRHAHQAPEIDGITYINEGEAKVGETVRVKITDAMDYDLIGGIVD